MRKLSILTVLAVLVLGPAAFAQDLEPYIYKFPEIEPEYSISLGFTVEGENGSERAHEYKYPHNSLMLGAELRALPFPHRLHLEIDMKNKRDYFGDFSYAYKDLVLGRWTNKTLYHNLDNLTIVDLGDEPRYAVDVQDAGEHYGVKSEMNVGFLRFKTPEFPFHIYLNFQTVDKEGTRQQRYLAGSGYFDKLERTTTSRDFDWMTEELGVGFNSHMGPVEVDYSHIAKNFEVEKDTSFQTFYYAGASRTEGVYEHDSLPDTKGTSDVLKMHTSYTGAVTASMTLAKHERENEHGDVESDAFMGAADVTWMPMTKLTLFLKYRHRDVDTSAPDTITVTNLSDFTTSAYDVRKPLSYTTDKLCGSARYRAAKGLTLRAEFAHTSTDRQDEEAWKLSSTTVRDTAMLSADMRLLKNLKVKAKYIHEEVDAPAYNTELDSADRGGISLSWTPVPRVVAYLGYDVISGSRDDVSYNLNGVLTPVGDRDLSAGKAIGMLGLSITERLSATATYAYTSSTIEQTLAYENFGTSPEFIYDSGVPYKEKAYTIAANLAFKASERLSLDAGVNYTKSRSKFNPSLSASLSPASAASYTESKMSETEFEISGRYDLGRGWNMGVGYRYGEFDNMNENPDNPLDDGDSQTVELFVSKRWK